MLSALTMLQCATAFALKKNPPVGFYTIMLGGDGKAADKKTFFIGKGANLENNFDDNKTQWRHELLTVK